MVEILEDRGLFSKTANIVFDTREDNEEREIWLKQRDKSIGGSEIAKILGLSKYGSAITVWEEKLGLCEKFKGNIHTKFGNRMEPIIRDFVQEDFKEATGINLKTYEYPYMMVSKEYDFISANIDGIGILDKEFEYSESKFINPDTLIGLEIKTASEALRKLWDGEEIPSEYYCQVQWYMYVTGLKFFMIIYMIGKEIRWKVVPRCDEDIDVMVNEAVRFWNENIIHKVMPQPIGLSVETQSIIIKQTLDIEDDLPISENKVTMYNELSEKIKELEQEREKIKQLIFIEMGSSKKGNDGNYKISRWTVKRESIDSKLLKEKYLSVYNDCFKGCTEYVNLRITKIKF